MTSQTSERSPTGSDDLTHLSDESGVVDYNHPLAEKPVVLTLKVLQVDDPGISDQY